jgi:hypothetical protein
MISSVWHCPTSPCGTRVPRHTSVRPGETAAVWRIPYPEPDVRANFPFVVEALSQTVVVAATADDGEDRPLVVQLTTANGGWAPVRGWPSPGFVVPTSAVVYPRDDWERASLDGEDHAVAFLVQPLGMRRLSASLGAPTPVQRWLKRLPVTSSTSSRAECVWRAVVPPRWPGQPLAAMPLGGRHVVRGSPRARWGTAPVPQPLAKVG